MLRVPTTPKGLLVSTINHCNVNKAYFQTELLEEVVRLSVRVSNRIGSEW